jgi:hypothetical protein
LGVRLSENGKLVERIVIKIKVFDTGKFEWKARQRYIKEPQLKVDDLLTILDGVKSEIKAAEGTPEKQDFEGTATETTTEKKSIPSKKNNQTKKNTTT